MTKQIIVIRPATKKRAEKETTIIADDPIVNSWQSMFVVTEHWKSDVKFFSDEVVFFKILLDKYFICLVDEKNIAETRLLISHLTTFEVRRVSLERDIALHLLQLTNLNQNPFAQNGQNSNEKHATLETVMADFVKEFRQLKTEVFGLAKKMINAEKTQPLLSNAHAATIPFLC